MSHPYTIIPAEPNTRIILGGHYSWIKSIEDIPIVSKLLIAWALKPDVPRDGIDLRPYPVTLNGLAYEFEHYSVLRSDGVIESYGGARLSVQEFVEQCIFMQEEEARKQEVSKK